MKYIVWRFWGLEEAEVKVWTGLVHSERLKNKLFPAARPLVGGWPLWLPVACESTGPAPLLGILLCASLPISLLYLRTAVVLG